MSNNDKIIKCLNCQDIELKSINCGQNLKIDQCPQCGGIWFDSQELNDLKELGVFYIKNLDNSSKIPIEKNRIRECPRCKLVLHPVKFKENKNIIIDRCNGCRGLWIDRGELIKISEDVF